MSKKPTTRLNYTGDLNPVIDRLCEMYNVGQSTHFTIIEVGYEDCNIRIEASNGTFLAKIFSKKRSTEDMHRYSTIMKKVVEAGVSHPILLKTKNGKVVHTDKQTGLSLVLMEFIDGQTFFELDRSPNDVERLAVIEQAAKINLINYHPPYVFDSWAIPNIQTLYDRVKEFIHPDDLKLVEQVMSRFLEVPIAGLPHCFVHGDFTKANVLKSKDGKIYILDFSVANWYPRIQELSVITANLLYDKQSSLSLKDKTDLVANEYSTFNTLTELEREHLYTYTLAGIAMEFMGSHQEKYINGNDTEETEYWLDLGRKGLIQELKAM